MLPRSVEFRKELQMCTSVTTTQTGKGEGSQREERQVRLMESEKGQWLVRLG